MVWTRRQAMLTNVGMLWTPCLAMFSNVGLAWLMLNPFQHLVLAMLLPVGSVWTACCAILIDVDRGKCHTSPFTQPRATWLIWLKYQNWESQCLKYSVFYQPLSCIPLTFIFIWFVAAKETDKQSQLGRRCTSPDISNMLQSIQLSQQQPTVSSVLADMRYALLSEFLCRSVI